MTAIPVSVAPARSVPATPADRLPYLSALEADRSIRAAPDRLLVIEADRLIQQRVDRAVRFAMHAAGDSAFANLRGLQIDPADMRAALLAALGSLGERR